VHEADVGGSTSSDGGSSDGRRSVFAGTSGGIVSTEVRSGTCGDSAFVFVCTGDRQHEAQPPSAGDEAQAGSLFQGQRDANDRRSHVTSARGACGVRGACGAISIGGGHGGGLGGSGAVKRRAPHVAAGQPAAAAAAAARDVL